jgi:hypothetical protein
MLFLREHKFTLLFLAVLVFCSVMVIRQRDQSRNRHSELREAMIVLETGGYTNEASRLYFRLWRDIAKMSNQQLVDDWRRTVTLVDPGVYQPSNSIYRYYWSVRTEMEKRSEGIIERARKLAEEEK